MRRVLVGVAATLLLVGCSGTADDADPPSTVVPVSSTPRPGGKESVDIEQRVALVYPGVTEGKAIDWSVALCSDILRGDMDRGQLLERASARFSGGDRPDPTPAQAEQILAMVEDSDFCEAG